MRWVALRRRGQNKNAPQGSKKLHPQGAGGRRIEDSEPVNWRRSRAQRAVSSSLRQWGWSKTRLTCFKSTALVRSRTLVEGMPRTGFLRYSERVVSEGVVRKGDAIESGE